MDEPTAGVIAGAIVLALVFSDIAGCTAEEREPEDKMVKAERGLAYACGYIHGQRAMITNAKLKVKLPKLMDECPRYTEEAIEAGFRIAGENR